MSRRDKKKKAIEKKRMLEDMKKIILESKWNLVRHMIRTLDGR